MSKRVPEGWLVGTLTEFSDINPRLAQRSEMNAETLVSFIKMEDVSNNAVVRNIRTVAYGQVAKGFTSFQNEDVLVAKITPCFENGKGGFVRGLKNGVGFGSTEFHVLRAKNNSSSEFLYQLTNADNFRLKGAVNMTGSAGQRRVPTEYLRTLDVIFPPLSEQQKIAAILSSVDDVIEKTRAQIDKLKDLKTGMMQELLTKGIGHTEFKDSPVGRIPAQWRLKALADAFTLSSGSTPSRSMPEYYCSSPHAHAWVKTLDLNDGLILKTEEKITDQAIKNSSCKVHPIGTVLVAMYGGWNQIGRSGLLAIPAATNQAICALLSKGIVDGAYANYWLASERFRWKSIAASSRKDPNITKQDVADFLITVPSLDEQKEIVVRLDKITMLIDKKIKLLGAYQSTKKALMQDLLTGTVRVNVD